MTWQCLHQVWCRLVHAFFKSPLAVLEHLLKTDENMSLIVNNSAANGPIFLKFGMQIDHMTRHLSYMFKVKESKVKVTARRNASKNVPNCE